MAVCQQARNKESMTPKQTQLHTVLRSAGWKLLFLNAKRLSSRSRWLESVLRQDTKPEYGDKRIDLNAVFLRECQKTTAELSTSPFPWTLSRLWAVLIDLGLFERRKQRYFIWEVWKNVMLSCHFQNPVVSASICERAHRKHLERGGPWKKYLQVMDESLVFLQFDLLLFFF